jgi:hypothetical protein
MSMESTHKHWRFSLKSLIGFVLALSLVGANARTLWLLRSTEEQLYAASQDNVRLRAELGYFDIIDETKPHVLLLNSGDQNVERDRQAYRFRLYLPPGKRYELCTATEDIGWNGFPHRNTPIRSEFLAAKAMMHFEVILFRPDSGRNQLIIINHRTSQTINIPSSNLLTKQSPSAWHLAGCRGFPQIFEPGENVEILRTYVYPPKMEGDKSIDYSVARFDGVLVWLEEISPALPPN